MHFQTFYLCQIIFAILFFFLNIGKSHYLPLLFPLSFCRFLWPTEFHSQPLVKNIFVLRICLRLRTRNRIWISENDQTAWDCITKSWDCTKTSVFSEPSVCWQYTRYQWAAQHSVIPTPCYHPGAKESPRTPL